MINMGAHTLFSLVDLYWIGSLGSDAIAAVALCGNILFSMFGLTIIIQIGVLAMISRRIGAANLAGTDGAEGVAGQASCRERATRGRPWSSRSCPTGS